MAHSFAPAAQSPISLEQFTEEMRAFDATTEDGLAAAADLFAALNANKRLLVDHIVGLLRRLRDDDAVNDYTGQTFMLASGPDYFVRANVWLPRPYRPLKALAESDQLFYDVAHDHNFTFMTAGHIGSGYRTTIYEYDGIDSTYNIGDRVDMSFLEDTMLPEGKIMIFRASRDIHVQYAPDEFSVSLNVMTINRTELRRTQNVFEKDCATVAGHPRGDEVGRQSLFAMVPALADARTEELLYDLTLSPDFRLHAHARGALDALAALRQTA